MAAMRNIKIWISIVCLATSLAAPAPAPGLTLDIIDMAAISRMTPQQLEALAEGLAAEEIMRTKRSSEALTAVASKASSGLQSKVGLLGQASAGVAGLISSASSKSGHEGYSYEPPQQEMKYDFFGLKKSILYTLFQAVKAITGGVTILKGQLIKGGGALAATLGKVISSKGDVVSNIGKKIVSSAALSQKKPAPPVYGPPPPIHVEYPPSAYGAPSAPAHYHSALSAPTGFASHKYPAHLDGRNKLNGLHAGLVLLAPVGHEAPVDYHGGYPSHPGHTPLEPPPSLIHNAVTAIKTALASAPMYVEDQSYQAPPPPPPPPSIQKPTGWGQAINSYGEPAPAYDSYGDYDPRNNKNDPGPSKKFNIIPKIEYQGLTSEKLEKINSNLDKLASYINENKRSYDGPSEFAGLEAFKKVFLPTPVSDNEVGVLPAEYLPTEPIPSLTSVKTTTTTLKPKIATEATRRKDVKFFLRGNRIVQV